MTRSPRSWATSRHIALSSSASGECVPQIRRIAAEKERALVSRARTGPGGAAGAGPRGALAGAGGGRGAAAGPGVGGGEGGAGAAGGGGGGGPGTPRAWDVRRG